MMCVAIVNCSVKVNHDLVGPVIPSRGLCQDDPFHLIFLLFVLNAFLPLLLLKVEVTFMAIKFVGELLLYLTSFLQTIVFFSSMLMFQSARS